ncbi:FadR/GntR family transcriptional regulator [Candidatus Protofrankia californiensis]|uniref:FadR/GntR family transcriptional regulator n=1 Tax=Candidatus Protofrankia californiensis TaxID=1839754 RepID=UPI0010419913|nr:FCD domain-containing protein [Candidatus Protofrankia californiensis]
MGVNMFGPERGPRFSKFSEMVADDLRGRMARGEVRPGEHLPPESELMDIYGVARPTMREALRILESESLIILRRGSHLGPLVQEPDTRVLARQTGLRLQMQGTSVRDLVEARAVVEPGAVALAAARRSGSDLRKMRNCLLTAGRPRSILDFSRPSIDFRILVVRSSHNKTLILMAELVSTLLRKEYESVLRNISEADGRQFIQQSVARYERLTDLIENRDVQGAVEFWQNHGTVDAELGTSSLQPGPMLAVYS